MKMPDFPWLRLRKKSEPEWPYEPPIMLGNKSNGEFFHEQTPMEKKIRHRILKECDERARKLGVDRRVFVASSMGMCTSLAVLNMAAGYGRDGITVGEGAGGQPGGYNVSAASLSDCEEADRLVGGDEFIIDMQTHFIEDETIWKDFHPGRMYTGRAFSWGITLYPCFPRSAACIGPDVYEDLVLMNSDTGIAVLSGFPSEICDDATMCTNLLSNNDMVRNRDRLNNNPGTGAMVLQHCQVAPNDKWPKQADMMRRIHEDYGNHGWKCYPPWGPDGQGWWLNDPDIADPFISLAVELGKRQNPSAGGAVICAHKGFPLPGFNTLNADPRDVGPAAVRWGDAVKFVVYHSGFEQGEWNARGYDPNDPNPQSVDRLVRTVEENNLKDKNVYAEMGSAWALVMNDPLASQHYVGKMVKYLGEDNVLWGSECVWFGSPQPQIEAFRALTITPELQERYGYPELTPELKAKILGRNAARVYNIDIDAARCDSGYLARQKAKQEINGEFGDRRWAFVQPQGPVTRREFFKLQKLRKFLGHPA